MKRVYAALAKDGLIKVGVSKDPASRIKHLNRRGRLKLIIVSEPHERALEIEKAAHQLLAFGNQQVAGEWFKATPTEARRAIDKAFQLVEGGELLLTSGAMMTRFDDLSGDDGQQFVADIKTKGPHDGSMMKRFAVYCRGVQNAAKLLGISEHDALDMRRGIAPISTDVAERIKALEPEWRAEYGRQVSKAYRNRHPT